jgi:hypothetical protein
LTTVLHAGDADDDRAEDDRGDDHLDQLDEAIAQRLHRRAGLRVEMPQQHTDDDGRDHLGIERFVKRFGGHGEPSWQGGAPHLAPPAPNWR